MSLSEAGFYAAKWTTMIESEWIRSLLKLIILISPIQFLPRLPIFKIKHPNQWLGSFTVSI